MKKKMDQFNFISHAMLFTFLPVTAMAADNSYSDVPADNWSVGVVNAARDYGLMQGAGRRDFRIREHHYPRGICDCTGQDVRMGTGQPRYAGFFRRSKGPMVLYIHRNGSRA